MAQTTASIVDDLKRRNSKGLEALYNDCGGLLYGLILRIVGNSGAAELIFQLTFAEIWNRLYQEVSSDSELRTLALHVGRRKAIQFRQGATNSPNGYRVSTVREEKGEEMTFNSLDGLDAAMKQLDDKDRELFDLVYFDGRSLSQIPLFTGLTRKEVAQRIAAIFKVLRDSTRENQHENYEDPLRQLSSRLAC